MLDTSRWPWWATRCTEAHRPLCRIDHLEDGVTVGSWLGVASGTLTESRQQFPRYSLQAVLLDANLLPDEQYGTAPISRSPLSLSSELGLWLGVDGPDGTPALIRKATVAVQKFTRDYPFGGITLTALSRCQGITDADFPFMRNLEAGSAIARLRLLVSQVWPNADVRVDPRITDATIPAGAYQQRDTVVRDIATSLGAELVDLPYGDFLLRPIPDVTGNPDEIVHVKGDSFGAQRSQDRSGVFNGIEVSGQAVSGSTPAAFVTDDNPLSPTYWNPTDPSAGFRHKVKKMTSSLVTSNDQARTVGYATLRDSMGAASSINYGASRNPARETSDIVRVFYPDNSSGGRVPSEQHVLDQITHPLGPGIQQVQTRAVALAAA